MQIVVTGINHETAPLSVRERLAVGADELPRVLGELRSVAGECFVLSTCNRIELYAFCGHEFTGTEAFRRWLAIRSGLSATEVHNYSYAFGHEAAVLHTFRVAAGLDSMVVGENEILGQMRRALAEARKAGALGPILDRLGGLALACGKRVRTVVEMEQAAPSLVSIAIKEAALTHGSLDGARVLVIGSGETAALAVRHVLATRARQVTVVNRTTEAAAALALAHGVESAPWSALPRHLAIADVVIGCTASREPVLSLESVQSARATARHPLVCLDLGVPRDIDPSVRTLDGVALIDIDQLGAAAHALRVERQRQIGAAEELVTNEVERFMTWWRERDVAPTIARLHQHAHRIQSAELDRALARLAGLSPREQGVVRTLAARLISKLLHDPTIAMKRDPEGANMAQYVDRLFRLTSPDDDATFDGASLPPVATRLSRLRVP